MQSVRYFCPILPNFVRAPNTKFHKNPPSGNRRDISGQRQTRGRTDTTNVRDTFRDLRNAPKNPDLIDGFVFLFYRKQHKRYFGLPVKCPTLLPNFIHFLFYYLRKSLQFQISRKYGN